MRILDKRGRERRRLLREDSKLESSLLAPPAGAVTWEPCTAAFVMRPVLFVACTGTSDKSVPTPQLTLGPTARLRAPACSIVSLDKFTESATSFCGKRVSIFWLGRFDGGGGSEGVGLLFDDFSPHIHCTVSFPSYVFEHSCTTLHKIEQETFDSLEVIDTLNIWGLFVQLDYKRASTL